MRKPRKAECQEDQRQLQAAKTTWALERRKTGSDVPSDADIFGARLYLAHKPKCPTGGEYSLNAVDELPTCSHPEHHRNSSSIADATSRAKLDMRSSTTIYRNPDAPEAPRKIYAKAEMASACDANRSEGCLYRSFSLLEPGPKPERFNYLLPEMEKLSGDWRIPYSLCCYCAQLGHIQEAKKWFTEAMALNEAAVKRIAIGDPDVEPLWEEDR